MEIMKKRERTQPMEGPKIEQRKLRNWREQRKNRENKEKKKKMERTKRMKGNTEKKK